MRPEYLTYNAEELAQEADFIRWVQQADTSLSAQWAAWLEQYPAQSKKVEDARRLVEAINWPVPQLDATQKASMWQAIDEATSQETGRVVGLSSRRSWWWSAAAAVVLLLVAAWWWQQTPEPMALYAARTEKGRFLLPDGSMVSLNAVTELEYATEKWSKRRHVKLEGEAFFEVEKGAKFTVETPYGTVEVLGTSFNVEARADVFRVNCYTGKVRVSLPNGSEKIITPQQGVEAIDGQLQERGLDNDNDIAWQDRVHHFKAQPLKEVFAELERQYLIEIDYPDSAAERLYTGSFRSDELRQSLKSVCWPMGLRFSMNQNQVLIQELQ